MLEDELGGTGTSPSSNDYIVANEARRILSRMGLCDVSCSAHEVSAFRHGRPPRRLSRNSLAGVLLCARLPELPAYRIRLAAGLSVAEWNRACAAFDLAGSADPEIALSYESNRLGAPLLRRAAETLLGPEQCRPLDTAAEAAVRSALTATRTTEAFKMPTTCWRGAAASLELELHVAFCAGGDWPTLRSAHQRTRNCAPEDCASCRAEAERLQANWHLSAL